MGYIVGMGQNAPWTDPNITKLAPEGQYYYLGRCATAVGTSTSFGVAASPDGQYVAYYNGQSGANAAAYWPVTDLTATGRAALNSGSPQGKAISMSNTYIALSSAGAVRIYRISDGGLETTLTGLGALQLTSFSPDGAYLAVRHGTSPGVRIFDVSDWSYVDTGTAVTSSSTGLTWNSNTSFNLHSTTSPYLYTMGVDGVHTASKTHANYRSAETARLPDGRLAILYTGSLLRFTDPSDDSTSTVAIPYTSVLSNSLIYDPDQNHLYVLDAQEDAVVVDLATDTVLPIATTGFFWVQDSSVGRIPACYVPQPLTHTLSGTVRDETNAAAERELAIYDRTTRRLEAIVESDVAGDFSVGLPHAGPWDVIVRRDPADPLNDLIYARCVAV